MNPTLATHGRVVRGAVAGVLATAVMSTVFVTGDTLGALGRKPPRIIVDHFLPGLPKTPSDRLALGAHLAYGAAAGVVFRVIPGSASGSSAAHAGRGVLFGVAVWAAGYEGWLPALGVLPPAHRDRRGRSITILAAHIVYGAAIGLLTHDTTRR